MSINYLANTTVNNLLQSIGVVYKKKAQTLLRLPHPYEYGREFFTFVKSESGVRVESTNKIGENVIARNEAIIGYTPDNQPIYNEWLIPKDTAYKNYGKDVIDNLSVDTFSSHKKVATVKAIKLTPLVMKELAVEGEVLEIEVSWSKDPMIAHIGDYLTDQGYSISAYDMKDYESLLNNS